MCSGYSKHLVRKTTDALGAGCLRDNSGKIVVEEDKLLKVWKEHYDRISKVEIYLGLASG